jgi:hypothetical protein
MSDSSLREYDAKLTTPEVVEISGSYSLAAADGYAMRAGQGVYSITGDGAGTHTITLRRKYAQANTLIAVLELHASNPTARVLVDASTVSTTKTITLKYQSTAGTDAEPSAGRCHFLFKLQVWKH